MPASSAHSNRYKCYTPQEQEQRAKRARIAMTRVHCDVLALWRGCANKRCKRHRRCRGDAAPCLHRTFGTIPRSMGDTIFRQVRAGGPFRVPPVNDLEWEMRQTPADNWLWGNGPCG